MMQESLNLHDVIEWDIQNWSVALQYWKKYTNFNFSSIYALEIGSRNGGLSLWAALNGAKVLCTDLEGPTEKAIEKHKNYNIQDLIKYKALDALDIPYSNEFDVVFFKSVLGGIGRFNNYTNQQKAIGEIYKSLKEGGEFWFAENLVASPFHQYFRKNL